MCKVFATRDLNYLTSWSGQDSKHKLWADRFNKNPNEIPTSSSGNARGLWDARKKRRRRTTLPLLTQFTVLMQFHPRSQATKLTTHRTQSLTRVLLTLHPMDVDGGKSQWNHKVSINSVSSVFFFRCCTLALLCASTVNSKVSEWDWLVETLIQSIHKTTHRRSDQLLKN